MPEAPERPAARPTRYPARPRRASPGAYLPAPGCSSYPSGRTCAATLQPTTPRDRPPRADQYHAYFDKARTLLSWRGDVADARAVMQQAETRERLARARPDEPGFHYDLGFAYAGLGRLPDATREHARYEELRRAHADTLWLRADGANDWAQMLLMVGRPDAAVESLGVVLADSSYPFASRAALRVSPLWAPLKDNATFKRLIAAPLP